MIKNPNLKFIFQRLSAHRRLVGTSVILMVLAAALEPIIPALMKPLLDQTIPNRGEAGTLWVPVLLLLAFLTRGLIDYFSNVIAQKISQSAIHAIRVELFSAITKLPYAKLRRADPGFYTSKVLNDVASISGALSTIWVTLLKDSLIVALLIAYLFYASPVLTSLLFISLPVAGLLVHHSSRKIRDSSRKIQGHASNVSSALIDYLSPTGLRDIYSLGIHKFAKRRFSDLSNGLATETITMSRRQATIVPLVQIIAAVGVCLAIALAISFPMGLSSPGEFVSFMAAMAMIFEPIKRLTNLNTVIQRGVVGIESVRDVLEEAQSIQASWTSPHQGGDRLAGLLITIDEKNYHGVNVLRKLSLDLRRGEFIGIQGRSGSGKSTIGILAAGLDDDFQGEIRRTQLKSDFSSEASGSNPSNFADLTPLSPGVLYLSANPTIFADSILNNVSFGLDSSPNHESTKQSLVSAGLGELSLELGCFVGCGGRALSAGEAQRLAIARAFFFQPEFLILDEATGSIDVQTERLVMKRLRDRFPRMGGVIISHRPSTYEHASCVYALKDKHLIRISNVQ